MSSGDPHCPFQHGKYWMMWTLCQPMLQCLHISFFLHFTVLLLLSPPTISSVCVYVSVVVPVCAGMCTGVCVCRLCTGACAGCVTV